MTERSAFMAKRKTNEDERPPPPVTGRTFQQYVNANVLPGPYGVFRDSAETEARLAGGRRGLIGSELDAFVKRRLERLPSGTISVRTARRWLKVKLTARCSTVRVQTSIRLAQALGFQWHKKGRRGMFVDGHEREDVVKHRDALIKAYLEVCFLSNALIPFTDSVPGLLA